MMKLINLEFIVKHIIHKLIHLFKLLTHEFIVFKIKLLKITKLWEIVPWFKFKMHFLKLWEILVLEIFKHFILLIFMKIMPMPWVVIYSIILISSFILMLTSLMPALMHMPVIFFILATLMSASLIPTTLMSASLMPTTMMSLSLIPTTMATSLMPTTMMTISLTLMPSHSFSPARTRTVGWIKLRRKARVSRIWSTILRRMLRANCAIWTILAGLIYLGTSPIFRWRKWTRHCFIRLRCWCYLQKIKII